MCSDVHIITLNQITYFSSTGSVSSIKNHSTECPCVLGPHEIIYNAAQNKHVYMNNCFTVYMFGSKALSHEGKQTVVSVFCPLQ